MIEAKDVSKFYSVVNEDGTASGVTAVNSVSLTIPSGTIVTLLGPSGCGKSTFLEMIAGLQPPSEGAVFIDGKLVLEPTPSTREEAKLYKKKYRFLSPLANGLIRNRTKHNIAMIFQDYAVFPWMTALGNITLTLKLRGVPKEVREQQATEWLQTVGLADSANKYPSQLSGGMRQRLALARALAVDPEVILMDEPFAAVDALTRQRLQEELLELWQQNRSTIVLVTHDPEEAVFLSDQVIVFTPAPGEIRNSIPIDLPHPRDRNDPQFVEYRKRIEALFRYDTSQESEYSI